MVQNSWCSCNSSADMRAVARDVSGTNDTACTNSGSQKCVCSEGKKMLQRILPSRLGLL